MIRKWLVLLASSLFFILSCEEEKVIVNHEMPYKIQEIRVPETISSTSNKPILITATVTHPYGHEGIQKVEAVIMDSMEQKQLKEISLFDDGSIENPQSGDVIAFDQVYSYNLIGSQLGLADNFYKVIIRAISVDDEMLQSGSLPLKVFTNKAPSIVEYFFPDSILVGFPETQASFTVNDSNGLDDIVWVILEGYKPGNTSPTFQDTVLNPLNNTAIFIFQLDSSYAAGKKGDYQMKVFAEDRVGDLSEEEVFPLYVENTPPELWDAVVPEVLQIPTSGDISAKITIRVNDKQSLSDVDLVYFNSEKPDGNPSTGNPFLMFDNGLPYDPGNPVAVGDEILGDGIYTLTVFLQAGTSIGTYTFRFFARDKVNQLTAGPIELIEIIN